MSKSKPTKAELNKAFQTTIGIMEDTLTALQKENVELRQTIKVSRDQFAILLRSGGWMKK